MIKILGDKIIRDSKVFVIKIGKYVFKIPLSRFAREEIREEHFIMQKVKDDEHFSKFLFNYKYYFFNIQCSPYFVSLLELKKKDDLMSGYFNYSFKDFNKWKKKCQSMASARRASLWARLSPRAWLAGLMRLARAPLAVLPRAVFRQHWIPSDLRSL